MTGTNDLEDALTGDSAAERTTVTRRTVLVGAGTATLAAALPALPTKPDWLIAAEATMAANGQLFITEHGRKVEREEWLKVGAELAKIEHSKSAMTIKFAEQKIKEARARIAALDRELAALQRSIRCLPSNHHVLRELREQATRLGDERCKGFQELLELIELAEMPPEYMSWA